jgi:hypothetical protein
MNVLAPMLVFLLGGCAGTVGYATQNPELQERAYPGARLDSYGQPCQPWTQDWKCR